MKKPKKKNVVRLMLRLSPEDHEKLSQLAASQGEVPMSKIDLVRTWIRRAWNSQNNHSA